MAYLAAVSSSTMPIFIRTMGEVPPLSFPTVGSLHGVQIFASKMQATLLSCSTSGAKVVWKQYCDSMSLILVTSDTTATDALCSHTLDLVFNAMVLLLGLHQLESVGNVERLKKDLKTCYPLIDFIFKGEHNLMSPLTQAVDVIALEDTSILSKTLNAFTEAAAKSGYGCLFINGRICVATEKWWDLSSLETSLLSLFLSSLPPASVRDIPVFLPKASNKTAHRLVIFTLFEGVHLCVLCAPTPTLTELQQQLPQYWSLVATQLRNSTHIYPRCVHLGLSIESSVLAFCLVNLESRKCLTSLKPATSGEYQKTALTAGYQGEMKIEKRFKYLSRFYKTVSGDILPPPSPSEKEKDKGAEEVPLSSLATRLPHSILATYICSKHYKAFASSEGKYHLFALFTPSTPTFALRTLTANLFETLAKTKL